MATIIDPEKAKSLIQEYQTQNATAGGPALLTPDKKFHNGFFIDRQTLEDILSNPDAVGIGFDFAKHPDFTGATENIFTVVFFGAALAAATPAAEPEAAAPAAAPQAADATTAPYVSTGTIYSEPPPCPPYCSVVGN
jgi:hypothetical protein